MGITQCPGGYANIAEVKPSPRARQEDMLPSSISGPCIPIGVLPPQAGHGSDRAKTCTFAPQTCWVVCPPISPVGAEQRQGAEGEQTCLARGCYGTAHAIGAKQTSSEAKAH